MIDFLFHRKKPLKKQILCFSIATTLSLLSLTSLNSLLNIGNPKSKEDKSKKEIEINKVYCL